MWTGADIGSYFVVVTDDNGEIYSDPAQLSVNVQVIFANARWRRPCAPPFGFLSGTIFQSDLAGLDDPDAGKSGIASVEGLDLATNLNYLDLDTIPSPTPACSAA